MVQRPDLAEDADDSTAPIEASSPVDQSVLKTLRDPEVGGDPEFLAELITLYLGDATEKVAAIQQALGRGDRPGLARAAHSLKGSSSNLGAEVIVQVCEQIENLGPSTECDAALTLIQRLEGEFERVREVLSRELEQVA